MPIEPGFKVRLGSYRITPQVEAARREVWDLLAPHLEAILNAHLDNAIIHAPFYKEAIQKNRSDLVRRVFNATKKLLLEPFDEAWVEDAYARAGKEIATGEDLRSRGAIAISILMELNRLIVARYPFSVKKAMRLMNVATQVFTLDVANAIACHKALETE